LYDPQKQITPYRVNVHNTRAKGGRSSTLRGEKYLADGEYILEQYYLYNKVKMDTVQD
jgi:hypothetical protein